MSRARNIKPGFFRNETLAECDPLARILFAGLWCEADRAGRLEDRPKRLKADCLPYDECDADALLDQLASKEFITRYVVDGKHFIQINEFAKHQNPHQKEAASIIPAPDENSASTRQATTKSETSRADSPFLIPDSKVASQPKGQLALPDWLAPELWKRWHNFRNSRKGWTRDAQELSLRNLSKLRRKGHDPTDVIEQSIERGWTGLFEIREEAPRGTNFQNRKLSASERVAQFNSEAEDDQRDIIEGDFRLSPAA